MKTELEIKRESKEEVRRNRRFDPALFLDVHFMSGSLTP
jgi:hypothetical protein